MEAEAIHLNPVETAPTVAAAVTAVVQTGDMLVIVIRKIREVAGESVMPIQQTLDLVVAQEAIGLLTSVGAVQDTERLDL